MKTKESGKILLCCCVFSFSFRRRCYTVLYRCVWLQHIAQSLASKCVSPPLFSSLFGWFNFTMYCHGYRKAKSAERASSQKEKWALRHWNISRGFVCFQPKAARQKKKERKKTVERIRYCRCFWPVCIIFFVGVRLITSYLRDCDKTETFHVITYGEEEEKTKQVMVKFL